MPPMGINMIGGSIVIDTRLFLTYRSIGCTVFEMACRKPPWSDMPPMPAIFAIGSGETVPQLPEKFSREARDFVNACLTR